MRRTKTKLSTRRAAELRALAALNRVRRGDFDRLSDAARAEGTTVHFIKERFPAALNQNGGRIRVKPSDPYSELVEIISKNGAVEVMARGSRQRQLAGRHRAVVIKVQRGELSPRALREFREVKIGGHELISDYDRLLELGRGGILDQLGALYVAPETSR